MVAGSLAGVQSVPATLYNLELWHGRSGCYSCLAVVLVPLSPESRRETPNIPEPEGSFLRVKFAQQMRSGAPRLPLNCRHFSAVHRRLVCIHSCFAALGARA